MHHEQAGPPRLPHEILAAWRAAVGLTQAEAASRVGIAQPSWRALEIGESIPSARTAARIQDATGIRAELWRAAEGRPRKRSKGAP